MWIWSHLLKKSLMENFIFYAVIMFKYDITQKEEEVSLKMRQCLKVFLVGASPYNLTNHYNKFVLKGNSNYHVRPTGL